MNKQCFICTTSERELINLCGKCLKDLCCNSSSQVGKEVEPNGPSFDNGSSAPTLPTDSDFHSSLTMIDDHYKVPIADDEKSAKKPKELSKDEELSNKIFEGSMISTAANSDDDDNDNDDDDDDGLDRKLREYEKYITKGGSLKRIVLHAKCVRQKRFSDEDENGTYDLCNALKDALVLLSAVIGHPCENEILDALYEANGDVEMAVDRCVKKRQNDVIKLKNEGFFDEKDILNALDASDGNVLVANKFLQDTYLHKFMPGVGELSNERFISNLDFKAKSKMEESIRGRMLMMQYSLSMKAVFIASSLIDLQEYKFRDCIEAAQQCSTLDFALNYLNRTCSICDARKTIKEVLSYPSGCNCQVCSDCFEQHIDVTLGEGMPVTKLVCPICSLPNLEAMEKESQDDYFASLTMMIESLCQCSLFKSDIAELFRNKLNESQIIKDPKFRYCAHCSEGFLWENQNEEAVRMVCRQCGRGTCSLCKVKWVDQHEGISCQQFKVWIQVNGSEFQRQEIAEMQKYLITCPRCEAQYHLDRGGCMHCVCTSCTFDFCIGCGLEFINKNKCPVDDKCRVKGLHAHHPRDCLFYLRDFDIDILQSSLAINGIEVKTEPPEDSANSTCPVKERHVSDNATADEECGREIREASAGLCEKHYKEYLVSVINENSIDPIDVMSNDSLVNLLTREGLSIPPSPETDEDGTIYRDQLLDKIKKDLPLFNPETQPKRPGCSSPLKEFEKDFVFT